LRVGALTETVTVTGESPIVDVQSVRRQMVLDNDIISAIPSSRSYNNLIQLIRTASTRRRADRRAGGAGMVVFGGFGGRSNEGASTSTASASARRSTAPACRRTSPTSRTRARSR
jgi:hypothetical protein